MADEMKLKLFEKMLQLEHLSEVKTYDGRNYFEQSCGAFDMLEILGLGGEYVRWSEGK